MKVSFYCQHVLGIGHFHRSLALCRALAERHPTTLILGGPPVTVAENNIRTLLLPGLEMDPEFQNLVPCEPGQTLAEVKDRRIAMLFAHIREESPDVFITELYPFGRKAFRFELEPLLDAMHDGTLSRPLCCSSVRDILVEKVEGREKFERRAVETLNRYFDGVLVHADPALITLADTFSRLGEISVPVHYTGFVTGDSGTGDSRIREEIGISTFEKLIVASIGGGGVGSELLFSALAAVDDLPAEPPCRLQLFCGPYSQESDFVRLLAAAKNRTNIRVDRFTDRFPDWLAAADLSISMAGYNTCMNLLRAGIPALVYPYGQNREQRLRAERLGRRAPIAVLADNDLQPQVLAGLIGKQLARPRMVPEVKLDGAAETVRQLEAWYLERGRR